MIEAGCGKTRGRAGSGVVFCSKTGLRSSWLAEYDQYQFLELHVEEHTSEVAMAFPGLDTCQSWEMTCQLGQLT